PPFSITPGSIAVDVKVSDCENDGSIGALRARLRPRLCPSIVGPSKKLKWILLHLRVLVLKMPFHNRSTIVHPSFVAPSRGADIHFRLHKNCRLLPVPRCHRNIAPMSHLYSA